MRLRHGSQFSKDKMHTDQLSSIFKRLCHAFEIFLSVILKKSACGFRHLTVASFSLIVFQRYFVPHF